MDTSRRTFIQSCICLALLPKESKALYASSSPKFNSSENQLRFPPLYKGETIIVQRATAEIWPGYPADIIRIGNGYIGPTIRVKRGEILTVPVKNLLYETHGSEKIGLAVHWHGLEIPAEMDGHPKDAITEGTEKVYSFQVNQRAGTYFYHSHSHGKTGEQVYHGLFGFLIVEDDEEQVLGLPSGEREILLAIQDVLADDAMRLVYREEFRDKLVGHYGNQILVNGTPNAFLSVSRTIHRLRIVNASSARVYKLGFENNMPFHVIASDGGLLEYPVEMNSVFLAPAERIEILVDFAKFQQGDSTKFQSLTYESPEIHITPDHPLGIVMDIILFHIDKEEEETFVMPEKLSAIERYNEGDAVRVRNFSLIMNPFQNMRHTINRKLFEMERIDQYVRPGELEIWEFENTTDDMWHPMHIHNVQFQILSRNGSKDIAPHERGWKDTVLVNHLEKVQVLVKFSSENEGLYLMHCHILEHEDEGMMINFLLSTQVSVEEERDHQSMSISPNPASDKSWIRFKESDTNRELVVFDSNGKTVLTGNIQPGVTNYLLNVNPLTSGIYYCRLGKLVEKLHVVH